MKLEKRIFEDLESLKTYLTSKGFVIADGEMRWGSANQDSNCYWSIDDTEGTMNFVDSDGNEAFPYSLTDFSEGRVTGVAFLLLRDNGCILNITPLNEGTNTSQFTLSCDFGCSCTGEINPAVPQNGLVVCTAEEDDGYWRYSWREKPRPGVSGMYPTIYAPPAFNWIIDNCRHNVLSREIPNVSRWEVANTLTISKVFLADGYWSKYIYMENLGTNASPGMVFKINGQKFISFCSADIQEGTSVRPGTINKYRNPCFLMADDEVSINNSSSTQAYSNLKTYQVGDYCIFNDLLYRCTTAIIQPEAFDEMHWVVTTVPQELLRN